jgi:hypothetical protein
MQRRWGYYPGYDGDVTLYAVYRQSESYSHLRTFAAQTTYLVLSRECTLAAVVA